LEIQRFAANPLIHPGLHPSIGTNINGPSLIRVPSWLEGALGRYYLYFSDHHGTFIRLAYADALEGPWQIHVPGALHLDQTPLHGHIASPDVHVDEVNRQIVLYFHGPADDLPARLAIHPVAAGQASFCAVSQNGLHFSVYPKPLGAPYFRAFRWHNKVYALGMPGRFYCARKGWTGFETGPELFTPAMRHSAVLVRGHELHVFYSNAGDCPECILHSVIDLRLGWKNWQASAPEAVLVPEMEYEGANLSLVPSKRGWAPEPVRQLRDPALFTEGGKTTLFYSIAGEAGIAGAEVLF
jgi:hypothetical protein